MNSNDILLELLELSQPDRERRYLRYLSDAKKQVRLDESTPVLQGWALEDIELVHAFGGPDPVIKAIRPICRASTGLSTSLVRLGLEPFYISYDYLFGFAEEMFYGYSYDERLRISSYGWDIISLGLAFLGGPQEGTSPIHGGFGECTLEQLEALVAYVAMNVLAGNADHLCSWKNYWSRLTIPGRVDA